MNVCRCTFSLSASTAPLTPPPPPPPPHPHILPQETASGLLYLHSVGIIHRDIKPGNILVGDKTLTAKIADYGISRVVNTDMTMTQKGTIIYQAPELSRGERYGLSADVYSLGLTMYEVCLRVSFGRGVGVEEGRDREDRDGIILHLSSR